MGVRFRNGRACPTCNAPAATAIDKAAAQAPTRVLTSKDESDRLWRHVLYGCGTIVGLIKGYAALGLPGDPREGIKSLIATLQETLNLLEGPGQADGETES